MSGYLFSGKIKCMRCSSNYRGKMRREVKVYICSTYNKDSLKCSVRLAIKEDDLIYIVKKHMRIFNPEINIDDHDLVMWVDRVDVTEDGYRIYYSDGNESIVENNRFKI